MKIIIAPDSYKDCASSLMIANYIENGFKQVFKEATYLKYVMADGGEGTVDSMILATDGERVHCKVKNPIGIEIDTYYGISQDKQTAFIEMAKASGLELLDKQQRNPLKTSTYGTGQLIEAAIKRNVKHIIIGIGGSATCDAGIGMAAALGIKFYDKNQSQLEPIGASLAQIASINYDEMITLPKDLIIEVACDVDNPLYGKNGASYVYNKQKGASEAIIKELDIALTRFSNLFDQHKLANLEGSGAAGGLGFGLKFFLGAQLKPGADIIIDYLKIADALSTADLVITGEGMTDFQSVMGKAPIGIAKLAKKYNVPTIMLSAAYGNKYTDVYQHGVTACFSPIKGIISLEQSINEIEDSLTMEAYNVAQVLKVGAMIRV